MRSKYSYRVDLSTFLLSIRETVRAHVGAVLLLAFQDAGFEVGARLLEPFGSRK